MKNAAEIEIYRAAARARQAKAQAAASEAARRARDLLPALTGCLVGEFGVRRLWLIGSLARGDFKVDSDIDLVAEGGLEGALLFRAGAKLEGLAEPFVVDLIPLADASERVLGVIAAEGEVLHDAD